MPTKCLVNLKTCSNSFLLNNTGQAPLELIIIINCSRVLQFSEFNSIETKILENFD